MWQLLKNKLFSTQALLGGSIAIGIILRIFQFGQIPVGTYWDETAIAIDAVSIAATGHDMHGNHWFQAIFPSYGDYKLPIYIWLSSLVVRLVESTELIARLPSLLAGLTTIFLAATLAGELAKHWPLQQRKVFQLASATVVSVSYWAILFSRTGFEGHVAQVWMGLAMIALLRSKRKPLYWLLAGCLGALALFTYYSTRFIWPLLWCITLAPILMSFVKKNTDRQIILKHQIIPAVGSLFIFLFSLIVMVRSPLYPASQVFRLSSDSIINQTPFVIESNYSKSLEGPTLVGRLVLHRFVFQAKAFANHFASHLSLDYLFFSGDQNLRHGTGMHGLFPLVLAPCLLLGILGLFKHHRQLLVLLLFWWLASLLPASVPYDVPHALRSLNSLLPASLIIGYGLTTLILAPIKQRKIVFVSFILVLWLELIAFSHYLFVIYPSNSASEWQSGYKQLAQYVMNNRSKVNQFWVNAGDGRFYLWLLAFGDLSSKEIQSLPWQDYQLNQIENIIFSDFVYTSEGFPKTPSALAGRRKEISDNLSLMRVNPQLTVPILDANQNEQFVVVYFNLSEDQLTHVQQ